MHTPPVNMLLEKKDDFLSDDAALLTITPLVISGKTVKKGQFRSFTPLLEYVYIIHMGGVCLCAFEGV